MNNKTQKIIVIILSLFTVVILTFNPIRVKATTSSIAVTEITQKENPIKSCNNYIVYYGYHFNNEVMEKLKTYDLVIINPLEKGADDARKELQAEGIKVYGYSSSIEIPSYDKELVNLINDSEKLKIDGKILTHWENNQLGDLRQSSYRTKVINKLIERISSAGYDGVFVDTLDDLEGMKYILKENDVEVTNINTYIEEMQQAGVDFLKEVKNAAPMLSIIQNRAFSLLDKGTNELVDAVLYEGICKSKAEKYYNAIKTILDRYTINNNGVVMALADEEEYYAESKEIAKQNKWLYYQTSSYSNTSIVDGSNYKIDIDG